MKLKNLIGDSKDLVHCSLCDAKTTWTIASKVGWSWDADLKNVFYCTECKKFLVSKLNDTQK